MGQLSNDGISFDMRQPQSIVGFESLKMQRTSSDTELVSYWPSTAEQSLNTSPCSDAITFILSSAAGQDDPILREEQERRCGRESTMTLHQPMLFEAQWDVPGRSATFVEVVAVDSAMSPRGNKGLRGEFGDSRSVNSVESEDHASLVTASLVAQGYTSSIAQYVALGPETIARSSTNTLHSPVGKRTSVDRYTSTLPPLSLVDVIPTSESVTAESDSGYATLDDGDDGVQFVTIPTESAWPDSPNSSEFDEFVRAGLDHTGFIFASEPMSDVTHDIHVYRKELLVEAFMDDLQMFMPYDGREFDFDPTCFDDLDSQILLDPIKALSGVYRAELTHTIGAEDVDAVAHHGSTCFQSSASEDVQELWESRWFASNDDLLEGVQDTATTIEENSTDSCVELEHTDSQMGKTLTSDPGSSCKLNFNVGQRLVRKTSQHALGLLKKVSDAYLAGYSVECVPFVGL